MHAKTASKRAAPGSQDSNDAVTMLTFGKAVRFAREGLYPESIATDVSEERLKRFFTKTDKSYQVTKQLREAVIFSVQNRSEAFHRPALAIRYCSWSSVSNCTTRAA